MLLLSFLSYVDRSVLAILSPTILTELHLSATQYGYAILVFSFCYMIANPIWGFWMDRAGLWITTLTAVLVWSLASGGHGLMLGFAGMCIARGVLGFGEGAAFPAGLKTVAETLPLSKRSFGLGIAYSGGSLGAALTPLAITPIALRYGWRYAFALTALLGLAWITLWLILRTPVGTHLRPPCGPSTATQHQQPPDGTAISSPPPQSTALEQHPWPSASTPPHSTSPESSTSTSAPSVISSGFRPQAGRLAISSSAESPIASASAA